MLDVMYIFDNQQQIHSIYHTVWQTVINCDICMTCISENVKTIHTISHQHGVLPAFLTLPHRVGCFERNSDESSRSLRILKRLRNGLPHNRTHLSQTHSISRNTTYKGASLLHYIKSCPLVSGSLSVVLPSTLSMKISRSDASFECQSPAEAAGAVSKCASFSAWNMESWEEMPVNIYCHFNKRVLWEHVQSSGPEHSRLPQATTWHAGLNTWCAGWVKMISLVRHNGGRSLKTECHVYMFTDRVGNVQRFTDSFLFTIATQLQGLCCWLVNLSIKKQHILSFFIFFLHLWNIDLVGTQLSLISCQRLVCPSCSSTGHQKISMCILPVNR